MSAVCPSCRTPAAPGATRCSRCNAFLDGVAAGAPPPIAATSFGQPAFEPPPGGFGGPPAPPAPGGYGPAAGGYGAPPAPGGYGGPPAPGGYGAPPAPGGYGAPPAPGGYGAPPAPGGYGAPPGMGGPSPYGAPPPMGGPGMGGPGAYGAPPPQMGYGGAPAYAPPQRKAGMSGCGIAAIVGAVVALLFGGLLIIGAIAAANKDDDSTSSNDSPPPPPADDPQIPEREDVPNTGALNSLIKPRVGVYSLKGVGDVTNVGSALQGGIVDSKGAEYTAPDGSTVTLLMLVYATEGIAQAKIDAVESIFRSEAGHVVVRSQVLNKQRRVVGARVRVTGSNPQRVYWTNGKLLSFTTANAPHAVGFEMAAPF